jgi:hypothetical protein
MKLEITVAKNHTPDVFVNAVQELRQLVMERVIEPCFHVPEKGLGPAEFYVLTPQFAISDQPFCAVILSGVSVKSERTPEEFEKARRELLGIFTNMVRQHFPKGAEIQVSAKILANELVGHVCKTLSIEGHAPYTLGEK